MAATEAEVDQWITEARVTGLPVAFTGVLLLVAVLGIPLLPAGLLVMVPMLAAQVVAAHRLLRPDPADWPHG
jgi:DNA-binding transcriptional regulator YbjK